MIRNPNCATAVKIGILWWCSLGCEGALLCPLQSDKTKAKGCKWQVKKEVSNEELATPLPAMQEP